jgi:aminoglycoside phosphotransferase (APT) family kinase protein
MDDPAYVIKRGDPSALAREARALRHVAGRTVAPELVSSRPGHLVTQFLPGRTRPLSRLNPGDAAALGATLRRVHETRRTASGGLASWPWRARSLAAYRRGRIADLQRAAPAHLRALASTIGDRSTNGVRHLLLTSPYPRPFRLLHGDLTAQNIVWVPAPRLVDWEFWRMGDPAEDLAYLFVVNDLPAGVEAEVLAGYGEPATAERIELWRDVCALDAGFWYLAHGLTDLGEALVRRASG